MTQSPNTAAPPAPMPSQPKTSGLAIGALVCGLAGCIWPAAIAAVGLGIAALVSIGKSEGQRTGKGMAVAGLVLGGILTVAVPLLFAAALLPAITQARTQARHVVDQTNLRQIHVALVSHANDYNGRFPDHPSQLLPYLGNDISVLQSPFDDAGQYLPNGADHDVNKDSGVIAYGGYLLLHSQARMSQVRYPSRTAIAMSRDFENDGGRRAVVYVDGHVGTIRAEDLPDFITEQNALRQESGLPLIDPADL